jgi:hypothetical protein
MPRENPSYHYRQSRDRYIKRLRYLLSCLPKIDGLAAFWVLDRGRMNKDFVVPTGYDYPAEFLFAQIFEKGAIFGWELESLVTELLAASRNSGPRTLNAKSWNAIAQLIRAIRKAGNAEAGLVDPQLIWRSMFRILHRQLPWQMHIGNVADAVRWWSIFESTMLQSMFENKRGLRLQRFIQLGLAWDQQLNRSAFVQKPTAIDGLEISQSDIEAFLRMISRPIAEATEVAREIIRTSSEIDYRRGALRDKPVINFTRNNAHYYIRPIEQLLLWRMTSGLYYDVIEHEDASNEIGAQFERYIVRLLSVIAKDRNVSSDFTYGTKRAPQRSPDCIISKQGVVEVLIECKAKKIPLIAQTSLSETSERSVSIAELAKGVLQLCRFGQALEHHVVPGMRAPSPPILLLVALDDWVFTGADVRRDIFRQGKELLEANGLGTQRVNEVVLCTATELDRLVSTYSYADLKRICEQSIKDQYRDYALFGVANECFSHEAHKFDYPLKGELDRLVGI